MTTPLFSIVMPTYNGAAYVRESVESALAQTMPDFELVIGDDGSTDGTCDIIREFKDDRLRTLGPTGARSIARNVNRLVTAARAPWVKFLFQDDLLAPDCLAHLAPATEAVPDVAVVRREYIFEPGIEARRVEECQELVAASIHERFPSSTCVSVDEVARACLEWGHLNYVGEPVALCVRRDAFVAAGGMDERLCQLADLEMVFRLAATNGLSVVHETLAYFRVHAGSESARNLEPRQRYAAQELEAMRLSLQLACASDFASFRGSTGDAVWMHRAKKSMGAALGVALWEAKHGRPRSTFQLARSLVRQPHAVSAVLRASRRS